MKYSFFILIICTLLIGNALAQKSPETVLLEKRNQEFKKDVIQVTDTVFTVTGYSVQPSSMIIGDDGIIIVDTGIDTTSAQQVLAEFRKITQKPVKAVIFTHSHGDHIGGAAVFVGEDQPQIWARDNFDSEANPMKRAGLTIQNQRGAKQAGFLLPPEQRINNGVAQVYYPKRGGEVFHGGGKEQILPTHTFSENRKELTIAGVRIDLVASPGETDDGLYVWLPEQKVVFSGDVFYKSWPNLYAIRGTGYRDVLDWANSVDRMLQEEPEFLVPGHTRPILGKSQVTETLTNYRDAILFVFHKTIEGMNKGMTPDELVDYVQLPEQYQNLDYLKPYYGNPEWAVRSIFNGYLGWFDGNPTNLFSLSPKDEAKKMIELSGGKDALLEKTQKALNNSEYQWSLQLCDYLIAYSPNDPQPKLIKATALEALASTLLTATGRNYYLTVAQELRKSAESK